MIRIIVLVLMFITLQWAGEFKNDNINKPIVDLHPKMIEKFVKSMIGIDELNNQLSKKIMDNPENINKDLIIQTRKEFKIKSLGIIFNNGLSLHEYKDYTKLFRADKDFKNEIMTIINKMNKNK